MDKIEWFIPFHIQLAVQGLIDEYLDTDEAVGAATVDEAFAKIADMRHNSYFANYHSRLEKTFDEGEYPFALAILNELAQTDELSLGQIRELAQKHRLENYPIVLRTLAFDGYIFGSQRENDTLYRFTSPVLRLWWRNYVK